MVESDLEVPLSPELVLVSPELRERALAEERNGRRPPSAAPPPVPPAQAPPAPPAQAPPVPPAGPQAGPAPTASGWRLTVGGVTVIALCAFVVFGAGFLIGQFLLSGSTARSVEPAPVPSRVPRKPVVAAKPVPTPQPKPTSSLAPARAPKRATKTVRPIPGGGYVLPAGRFQVSSNGRTISDFTLERTCAGQVVLPAIEVEAAGAFAFAGHPAGSSTTVRVKGRFVTPTEARGTTRVTGTACRAPATAFVARLS